MDKKWKGTMDKKWRGTMDKKWRGRCKHQDWKPEGKIGPQPNQSERAQSHMVVLVADLVSDS